MTEVPPGFDRHKAAQSARLFRMRLLSRLLGNADTGQDANNAEILAVLVRIENLKLLLMLFMSTVLLAVVLDVASQILIPITIAWFLSTLFSPGIKAVARIGIPAPLTSLLLVMALVSLLLTGIAFAAEPAGEWMQTLPESLRALRERLTMSGSSLVDLQELSDEVNELTSLPNQENRQIVEVVQSDNNWLVSVLTDDLPVLSSILVITMILTYFMLASGDQLLRSTVRLGSSWAVKRRVVQASRQIQRDLGRYLFTIAIINACLSVVVGAALWALGVSNPFFWGLMAGMLNFAPYVGPLVTCFLLLLVGVTEFESLKEAALVPGVFLVITSIEGQLITPTIVGRALSLNPLIVFIAVLVLTWLWGMVGALMAAPLVTTIRILWKNSPELREILLDHV